MAGQSKPTILLIVAAIIVIAVVAAAAAFLMKPSATSTTTTTVPQSNNQVTTTTSISPYVSSNQQSVNQTALSMLQSDSKLASKAEGFSVMYTQQSAYNGQSPLTLYYTSPNLYKINQTSGSANYTVGLSTYVMNSTEVQCTYVPHTPRPQCNSFTLNQSASTDLTLSLVTNQAVQLANLTTLKGAEIKYSGTQSVLGRQCDAFNVSVPAIDLAELEHVTNIPTNGTYSYSMCVDKSLGIPLLESTYYSTTLLASFQITNITMSIPQSAFQIPINYSNPLVSCYQNGVRVSFTSFRNAVNGTVVVSNLTSAAGGSQTTLTQSLSGGLTLGSGYNATIMTSTGSPGLMTGTTQYPKVCIEGSCTQESCYGTSTSV